MPKYITFANHISWQEIWTIEKQNLPQNRICGTEAYYIYQKRNLRLDGLLVHNWRHQVRQSGAFG